jgi:hypothetical protein
MASRRKNPETELQNQIIAHLNNTFPKVRCWRNSNMTGRMPSGYYAHAGLPKGSADIICCVKGKFLALEVKMPGKQPSEEQEKWGAEVTEAGGVYEIVHCINEAVDAVKTLQEM